MVPPIPKGVCVICGWRIAMTWLNAPGVTPVCLPCKAGQHERD